MFLFGLDIQETINGWIQSFLENTVWRLLYYLEIMLCKIIAIVEDIMMIFTGEKPVSYKGEDTLLIDIFFDHPAIRGIYGAMALIGIAFAFAFAIVAVIRKILDLRGKQQGVTLGTILGNLVKSIFIIISMNFFIMVAITTTNILTQQVSEAITKGEGLASGADTHVFTNEEYAAMGRIINTIGNYSINPSYRSRYNLNACYNDIRKELIYLGNRGVFDYNYEKVDENGNEVPTWQGIMVELGTAYDYTSEAPLDSYDEGLTNAMLDAIEILQANQNNMYVFEDIGKDEIKESDGPIPMDRILFLAGTMSTMDGRSAAARNDAYNKSPSFFDNVRRPFYTEDGKMYDFDAVKKVFDPSPSKTNYVLVYFVAIAIAKEMLVVIVTCSLRIFNLLALYIASPLAVAAMPLDDGGKFKQWMTAFVVQLLTIIGMVISLRLFLMFLPIVWSPDLAVGDGFSGVIMTLIVKMVIMYGAIHGVSKVNGIFTGILADSAGYQAITASGMRDTVENSSVGKKLSGMSAGAMVDKASGKVGEGANKVAGKLGIGKVTDALGITSGAQKSLESDPAHKQGEQRKQEREKNTLKRDLDYAKKTGKHLNGMDAKRDIPMMEKTLQHMEGGASLGDAKKMASEDLRQDKMDQKQNSYLDSLEMKNPPPQRDMPANQNN